MTCFTIISLLVALLSLVAPVYSRDGQTLTTHDIYLSHLSPMITYLPLSPSEDIPTGWDVSLASHRATRTGAAVEFGYFGRTFEVWGNGSDYDWEMSNKGDDTALQYVYREETGRPAMFTTVAGIDLDWHDVQLRLNESEVSFMDIRGYMLRTELPQLNGYSDAIHMHAAWAHDYYRRADPAGAWAPMEATTNQTTNMPFTSQYTEPPPEGSRNPFNSTVLSTNQTGERFYFEMPPGTSIVQVYGTVGPDQGRYEVRLAPATRDMSEETIQFTPHPYNQTFTAESPVDADLQVVYYGWVDPRVNYAMEIELLEEGKRIDIHGASFWRFADAQSGRPELDDWYPANSNSGLSGGQIAGIVVGSVAGAALIGLAIWFFIRRRNRAKPKPASLGKDDVESSST